MRAHATAPPRPAYKYGVSGFLHQHRALVSARPTARLMLGNLALVAGLTAGWLYALRWVVPFWGHLFAAAQDLLGLPGRTVMAVYAQVGGVPLAVPYLDVPAGPPGYMLASLVATGTAIVLVASTMLPHRMTPLAYLLRALALIQLSALLYFALTPETFPFTLADYVKGMMMIGLVLITLLPTAMGLIYYIHDVRWTQKAGLTLLMMGYMTVFIPLQYLAHAVLLHVGSLAFLPLLYFVFGVLLDVLVVIALYAWGMSWRGRVPLGSHPVPPPT